MTTVSTDDPIRVQVAGANRSSPSAAGTVGMLEHERDLLRRLFPMLAHADFDHEWLARYVRGDFFRERGVERLVLVPRWSAVSPTYRGALLALIDAAEHVWNDGFEVAHPEILDQHRFCGVQGTERSLAGLMGMQRGDLLLVPAQCGIRHVARPARDVHRMSVCTEFGLDVFSAGVLALLDARRLEQAQQTLLATGSVVGRLIPTITFSGRRVVVGLWLPGMLDLHACAPTGFVPRPRA